MNLIIELLNNFFNEEKVNTIILLILCIFVNIIQTNSISSITANIINYAKDRDSKNIYHLFTIFITLSIVYLILYFVYKIYQNKILTKLRQWIRYELTKLLLINNNENFSEINFIKLNSPINRVSTVCFMIISDLITFILPIIVFLFIISAYFLYKNIQLGSLFVAGNLVVFLYLYLYWGSMIEKNEEYEKHVADSEFYLLEILNNIDKIIYRGQTTNELDNFNEKTQKTISKAYDFYANVNIHGIIMNIMVYAIIFIFIYLLISLYFTKKIDLIMFVTFFSIIILYRDKMAIIFQQISDFIEFMGRTNVVLNHFKNMENKELNKKKLVKLAFDKIVFQNVTFKYKTSEKYLFKNFNMTLNTNNKIIGITGLSGKGKSTFAKLLIKLYQYEGDILIDDQNIKNIDADYIRQNIIYVNQSGKLFDKLVIDNILYGCEKTETCEKQIKMIMENYPKINELYKNVDLYRKKSGSLGENLSGGQRQVINIIGGLINPSKILILDEPTNALDIELKRDILDLISYYRKHKKCIIIITHDKDAYHLFNEKITI